MRLISFSIVFASGLWPALLHAQTEFVVVTASRIEQQIADVSSSISVVSTEDLQLLDAVHPNQVFNSVPGAWVSRGYGQEHLTAIRSPVFTGPGSCGNFYMAEDGIPLRGTGFCNVNQLFDVNIEQARRVEVLRGPGTTSQGANALHGVINVISMPPAATPEGDVDVELGPHDYRRAKFSYSYLAGPRHAGRLSINATHDGGYVDHSGFDQQKLSYRHAYTGDAWQVDSLLSVSNIDQDTAGYTEGKDSYKDYDTDTRSDIPDAYRENLSARFYSRFIRELANGSSLQLTPYLRYVESEFLQHFLPGQPTEASEQQGVGLQTAWFHQQSDTFSWRTGIDLEYTAADLTQTQVAEVPWSDVFPVGKQYDYAVDSVSSAVFANIDWQATQTTLVNAGLRFNSIWYDYDNRMINGSSTEDGSSCAGGPCRYSRPADRDDSFNNWSFDLGVTQDISRSLSLVGTLKQGFRPPQSTELYRLQAGQEVADIQSEEMQSVEAGLRGSFAQASFSLVGFAMRKDNVIFADAQRRNVSDGKTEHWGLEYSANWQLLDDWTLQLNGTYARHYYANNAVPNGVAANSDIEGNDIDTAPRHMGSLKVQWAFHSRGRAELEWLHMGEYYLEPENLYTYAGHNLLNLRTRYQFTDSIAAGFRVTNLANVDYAERADYAFGEYRYFVGEPRSLYADISFSF